MEQRAGRRHQRAHHGAVRTPHGSTRTQGCGRTDCSSGTARTRVASVEARVEALRNSQRNAATGAVARVRMAQARVRSAEQGVRAADAALTAATLNRDRQASLVRDGLTSTRNMELAELAFVRARTDVDRAQAALSAARSEESALDGDRLRIGTDLDASINDGLASRAAALSEVASANASLAGIEVRLARREL